MSKRNVARGFVTDATKLIQDFAARRSSDFADFQDVWKKKKFSMIFLGRPSEKELLEFTHQILRITLELFDNSPKENNIKLGYLFLLYGLFRYQPLKPPVKARITLEHFKDIAELRDEAAAEGNKIVLFIIRYMVQNGFEFVGAPTLMGPTVTNAALKIQLPTETADKLDEVKKRACGVQKDVSTCFQELKLVKRDYEEQFVTQSTHLPTSVSENVPFAAFLNALEPYSPQMNSNNATTSNSRLTRSNKTANQASGDIGKKRTSLKAAAYDKAIDKAARYESKEEREMAKSKKKGRPGKVTKPDEVKREQDLVPEASVLEEEREIAKNKKKGRPRKVIEPNEVKQEQDLVPEASVRKAVPYRGQKREKLFKGCKPKYHDLEEIKPKNETE